jgi:hypothetical protein
LVNFKKAAWERSLLFIDLPASSVKMMKHIPGNKELLASIGNNV